MKDIIRVTEKDGAQLVSARELYIGLGHASQHWKRWYNKNIVKNEFAIENEDYTQLPSKGRSVNFALTLDFAKKLSMLARTEKGEEIRNYFIEVEKGYNKNLAPYSNDPFIQLRIKQIDNSNRISNMETKLDELEAKTTTRPEYYTVAAYGTIKSCPVNTTMASRLGRAAARLCKQKNLPIDKVNDTRWGFVNSYPKPILEEVFNTTL